MYILVIVFGFFSPISANPYVQYAITQQGFTRQGCEVAKVEAQKDRRYC